MGQGILLGMAQKPVVGPVQPLRSDPLCLTCKMAGATRPSGPLGRGRSYRSSGLPEEAEGGPLGSGGINAVNGTP